MCNPVASGLRLGEEHRPHSLDSPTVAVDLIMCLRSSHLLVCVCDLSAPRGAEADALGYAVMATCFMVAQCMCYHAPSQSGPLRLRVSCIWGTRTTLRHLHVVNLVRIRCGRGSSSTQRYIGITYGTCDKSVCLTASHLFMMIILFWLTDKLAVH